MSIGDEAERFLSGHAGQEVGDDFGAMVSTFVRNRLEIPYGTTWAPGQLAAVKGSLARHLRAVADLLEPPS